MPHESLSTTMGYLHPETAAIKAVIDRRNEQKLKPEKADEQAAEQLSEEKEQKYMM
jgi:hypothetical protein